MLQDFYISVRAKSHAYFQAESYAIVNNSVLALPINVRLAIVLSLPLAPLKEDISKNKKKGQQIFAFKYELLPYVSVVAGTVLLGRPGILSTERPKYYRKESTNIDANIKY